MAEDTQTPPAIDAVKKKTTPSEPTPFIPPTIHHSTLLSGESYTHFSPIPPYLLPPTSSPDTPESEKKQGVPCCLGIDEAGRGPVLGPMVYGTYYLPVELHRSLLADEHGFDDSKVLKPEFRAELMERICTPPEKVTKEGETPDPKNLYLNSGYGVSLLSASSISSAMLAPTPYNLNAQAVDATISLINGVIERGVNVREIYIDTIGQPGPYQTRLERVFPGRKVTVEKKADSLFPVVSAASVVAKVTRDVGLEEMYEGLYQKPAADAAAEDEAAEGDDDEVQEQRAESKKRKAPEDADWGSGYPSDVRCTSWLKRNMNPVFGWGTECRFSWGTCKDLLEKKEMAVPVEWPVEEEDEAKMMSGYFTSNISESKEEKEAKELAGWFGQSVEVDAF